MGAVLYMVVQGQLVLYEQEDVAYTLSIRRGLMQKTSILMKPQIDIHKHETWQLVTSITIWYIWEAMCLKVFQNVTEIPAQIIIGIWTKIVHNLKGSLDNIKGNT